MAKTTAGEIDRDWFVERLAGRKISQRKLAKHLGLDPAAITLVLQNRRKITNQEAHEMAGLLGVSVSEILRRAGVPTSDDVRKVAIAGVIGEEGKVTIFPQHSHDMVICPADVPASGFALQVRAASNYKDGWLYFVSGEQLPPEGMLDKFVVAVTTDGRTHVCIMRRGYKSGTFNLLIVCSKGILENESLSWVSPVVWIKPL